MPRHKLQQGKGFYSIGLCVPIYNDLIDRIGYFLESAVNVIKTFGGRKLQIFVISVCSWQAFPAESIVFGQGQEPTLEWNT
jgi:hypothetical protein